jgi:hypothetical protein
MDSASPIKTLPASHADHRQLILGQGNVPGLSSGNPLEELAITQQKPITKKVIVNGRLYVDNHSTTMRWFRITKTASY